jgi:peptidoglycan/xylan/chitin deacetylase (PgdA/CDA1 family)
MGTILGFHSITTSHVPAGGEAHVSLQFFKRAVGLARRMGELVPLETIVRRHAQGLSTAGLVGLTFDDAYAALQGDFEEFVAREQVPISVFVVSGAAGSGTRFWWDRVDDAFARVSRSRWREFEIACGVPDDYRDGQPREFGPLRPLRQWMLREHAGQWPDALEPALAALEADAGSVTRHRSMTFEELERLARLPTVDVGVHTASHRVLPLLADGDLRREVVDCHDALRARFNRVLPILAFPFALFDRRTIQIARSAGMTACLSLAGTNVEPAADPGALPRICLTTRDTIPRLAMRLLGLPETVRRWTGRQAPAFPDLPSAAT